jgi:hypothetical protein
LRVIWRDADNWKLYRLKWLSLIIVAKWGMPSSRQSLQHPSSWTSITSWKGGNQ